MDVGQVISGKYRLLRLLGDGGMGAVYEAHHEVLGSNVAIKVLHQELSRKKDIADRFLREARVLARIRSANVVRVLDVMAEGDGPAYIVMELLTGEPLSSVLRRERKLPLSTAVDYATQILDALAAAHALGVIHRDLKPENVFVTREGDKTVLKVIDFGIAKEGGLAGASANLTIAGTLMGTPEYMAPEQAHSADRADARSDVFAVGVMLYEMLAAARPVDGEDPRAVAAKVEKGEATPLIVRVPDVPRELAGLVHRAMAARPELRFASAVEMRAALASAATGKRASSPPAAQTVVEGPPVGAPMPESARASGTLIGDADGAPPSRVGAGGTDRGAPPPSVAGPVVPPGPGSAATPEAPPTARARNRRKSNGMTWAIGVLTALAGGGFAIAFAFTGSPRSTPKTPARTNASAIASELPAAASESAPEVVLDPALAPLPLTKPGTVPRAIVSPPPRGSSQGGRPPGPPGGSASAAASPEDNPFGIPPFSLPSSLPSVFPFPGPGGSAPVITIPTTFAPFGFPAPPPASPPPAPPAHAAPAPAPAAPASGGPR